MSRRWFRPSLSDLAYLVPKDRGARSVARGLPYGDHPRQRLDLYAPRAAGANKLPVILFFYGGSWSSGSAATYAFVGHALAAQGFLAVVADYRLVPEVRFPAFIEDGAAAVAWVRGHAARFGADPDRIVLMGHSAGAHIAAMLALDARWLAHDRSTIRALIGLAGPYDFLPFRSSATRAAFGGEADPTRTQPIAFASADAPPTLLLHGSADRSVSPENSRTLARRLRQTGAEAELILYPEIAHVSILAAIAMPLRRRTPVLADLIAFAGRHASERSKLHP